MGGDFLANLCESLLTVRIAQFVGSRHPGFRDGGSSGAELALATGGDDSLLGAGGELSGADEARNVGEGAGAEDLVETL